MSAASWRYRILSVMKRGSFKGREPLSSPHERAAGAAGAAVCGEAIAGGNNVWRSSPRSWRRVRARDRRETTGCSPAPEVEQLGRLDVTATLQWHPTGIPQSVSGHAVMARERFHGGVRSDHVGRRPALLRRHRCARRRPGRLPRRLRHPVQHRPAAIRRLAVEAEPHLPRRPDGEHARRPPAPRRRRRSRRAVRRRDGRRGRQVRRHRLVAGPGRVSRHRPSRLVRRLHRRPARHRRSRRLRAGAAAAGAATLRPAARRSPRSATSTPAIRSRAAEASSTAHAMHVDLLLDPFGARWTDLRDAASVAVDTGFGGIWTYDHVDGRVYDAAHVLECWTILSALAAVVPSVVLGSHGAERRQPPPRRPRGDGGDAAGGVRRTPPPRARRRRPSGIALRPRAGGDRATRVRRRRATRAGRAVRGGAAAALAGARVPAARIPSRRS